MPLEYLDKTKDEPAPGEAPVAPLSPEISAVRDIMRDPKSTSVDRLGALAPYLYYKGRDALIGAGIRGAPPAIGQQLGRRFGGPIGQRVGGFIGGGLGELGAELYEGKAPQAGAILAGAGAGAFAANPMNGAGPAALAREALKQGGVNLAAKAAGTGIDEGRMLTAGEAGTSFAGGAFAPVAGKAVGTVLGARGLQPTPNERLYGAGQQQSFRDLRGEGVKVLPQNVLRGNDTIGALAGRTTLQREIDLSNQGAWQKLARDANGLSKEARPLFHTELDKVRERLESPYQEFERISSDAKTRLEKLQAAGPKAIDGPSAAALEDYNKANKHLMDPAIVEAGADVNALKIARDQAQKAYKRFDNGDPAAYAEWQNHVATVDALNGRLVDAAQSAGKPELVAALTKAREKYAISYATQAAIQSPRGGLVDIAKFGQMQKMAPGYLTGNLAKMGNFALDFKRDAVEATRVLPPGVNNMSANQQMQMLAEGNAPGMFMAAASKLAGPALRPVLKSNSYQNLLAKPETRFSGARDLGAIMARLSTAAQSRAVNTQDFSSLLNGQAQEEAPLTDQEQARMEELRALQGTPANANP